MPKSLDKTKGARKRKKTPANSVANSESDGSETKQCPKKKKITKKSCALEGIAMSKQLAAEMQKKKIVRSRNSTKNNNEPRLLGNGKPMPSLAELEAMYADSDGDDDPPKENIQTTTERCSTPESKPILTDKMNLDSPETLLKLKSKAIDILSKKVIDLCDDEGPPPPVIPQKKPKKSDIPYIVGCAERPQVPWAPKTKWCVGIEDYGIDKNQPPDDEEPKSRKKRGQPVNISKSIFNAKSDEIAERLKELDTFEMARTGSPDSNKTVEYDFPSKSPVSNMPRSFSPLPSTSRDAETILKNDQLFNESLQNESVPSESSANKIDSQDEIEIIDIPYETVVLDDTKDDTLPNVSVKSEKQSYIDDLDDDCCILVEPEIKRKKCSESSMKADSPPPKDDIYGSIDLTQPFVDNEVYEINDDDIDDLIAESKAILEKHLKKNEIDTVTAVDPSAILVNPETENSGQTSNNPIPSTSTASNSEVICHSPGIVECVELESTVTESRNDVVPIQESQNTTNNDIAEVVTNFFNAPQGSNTNSIRSSETTSIDLTSSTTQDTMMNRISSWIHSLESLFSGRPRQSVNSSNDVICLDDSGQSTNQRQPNICVVVANHQNTPICCSQQRRREVCNCHCPSNPPAQSSSKIQRQHPHHSIQSHRGATHDSVNSLRGNNAILTGSTVQQTNQQPNHQPQIPTIPRVPSQPSPPRRGLGDCPICMDSLANTTVASTLCGHVFCMPCIRAAIRANGKRCPTCRKVLKGKDGFHQLFI